MITFNNLIQLFNNISTAHLQVHSFGSGELPEIDGAQETDKIYPKVWLFPVSSTVTDNIVLNNFNLFCFDLVHKDITVDGNEVLSDTQQILYDIIKVIKDASGYDYDVIGSVELRPFTERFGDDVTGWYADLDIQTIFNPNSCDVPIEAFTIPSNDCEDCTSTYQWLTCGSLSDCVTFSDLEARVDALEGLDLTANQYAAINAANAPTGANPFATLADLTGGGESLAATLAIGNTTGDLYIDAPDATSHLGILSGGQFDWTSDAGVYSESWIYADPGAAYFGYNGNYLTVNDDEVEIEAGTGSLFIDSSQANLYSSLGGFFSSDGILSGPRFVQISTADLKLTHNTAITITSGAAGAEYAADYSAGYTNRSLVDKEYVDGLTPATPTLPSVLAAGNTTGSNNIEVSNNQYILGNGAGAGYLTFGTNGGNITLATTTSSITKGALAITGAKSLTLTSPLINVNGQTVITSLDTFSGASIINNSALIGYDDGTFLAYYAASGLESRISYSDSTDGGGLRINATNTIFDHTQAIAIDAPSISATAGVATLNMTNGGGLEFTADAGGYAEGFVTSGNIGSIIGFGSNYIGLDATKVTVTNLAGVGTRVVVADSAGVLSTTAFGASGFSGYSGVSGYSGSNGSTGTSGFSGYSGVSGFSGGTGSNGASGFSGYSGVSGFSGTSGFSGYSGVSGLAGAVEFYGGTLDGQGGVIANNSKFTIIVPYTGTITGWTLLEVSDTPISSTVTLDAWKSDYTSYPPVVGGTIFGTKPALSTAIKNKATGLSIAVTAGDIIIVNADSISLANKIKFGFNISRS